MVFNAVVDDLTRYRNVYAMAVASLMGYVCYGWEIGMMGGILSMPSFQHSFGLDTQSAAAKASLSGNIVSVLQAGGFFGSLFTLYTTSRWGRKSVLIVSGFLYTIGGVIQAIAGLGSSQSTGLSVLYFGRFFAGLGVGLLSVLVPSYLSECTPKAIRGRITGGVELTITLGSMLCFWVNYGSELHLKPTEMQWRLPFVIQLVPSVLFTVLMFFQPESPRWLVERGRYDDAARSLAYIARKSPSDPAVLATLDEIKADYLGKQHLPLLQQFRGMGASKITALRCFIPSLLTFFQQWTGANAVNYYSPQIFAALGLTSTTSGLLATGVYGVVKLLANLIGLFWLIEQLGRKRCLVYGSLGSALSMLYVGIFLGVHPEKDVVPGTYVSLVAIFFFSVFLAVGWGPCTFVVATEVAPNHLRTAVMALAGAVMWLFTFVIAQITPVMLVHITYGTYLLFGVFGIVMGVYAYFGLPETAGYPLEDVRYLFEHDLWVRALEDAPLGWIFLSGQRKSTPVSELRGKDMAIPSDAGERTSAGSDEEKWDPALSNASHGAASPTGPDVVARPPSDLII